MFLMLLSTFAVASSCPDLSGTFTCPDDGSAPAYEMTVSQKMNSAGNFEYSVSNTQGFHDVLVASEDGVTTVNNSFFICIGGAVVFRKNHAEYYHKISPEGAYKIVSQLPGGRPTELLSCTRK